MCSSVPDSSISRCFFFFGLQVRTMFTVEKLPSILGYDHERAMAVRAYWSPVIDFVDHFD